MTIDGIEYLAPETVNGLNLYAYCGNNPVMGVDPNGCLLISFLLIVAAATVTAGLVSKAKDIHYNDRAKKNQEYKFPDNVTVDTNPDLKGNDPIRNAPQLNEEEYNFDVSANCHQFTAKDGKPNYKVVTKDGRYEAIYDSNGNLVEDPRDIGTYNYCPLVDSAIGHFFVDVLPWIIWGNSADDTTTVGERIYYMIFS